MKIVFTNKLKEDWTHGLPVPIWSRIFCIAVRLCKHQTAQNYHFSVRLHGWVLRKIFCFKVDRGKRGVAKNTQRGPSGTEKRKKYSSSDPFTRRLAQQIVITRQIRGLYISII